MTKRRWAISVGCTSEALSDWLNFTADQAAPAGLDVGTSLARARRFAERLNDEKGVTLGWSDELPDVLYALSWLLVRASDPCWALSIAGRAYDVAVRLEWPSQVIDEKSGILATLAYAAWNASRKSLRLKDMRLYEARCETHVDEQPHARDFFGLSPNQRSRVTSRFLSDPPVLLVAWLKVHRLLNSDPVGAADGGRELVDWIGRSADGPSSDEAAWFECQAAILVVGGLRHLGEIARAAKWLRVRGPCRETNLLLFSSTSSD